MALTAIEITDCLSAGFALDSLNPEYTLFAGGINDAILSWHHIRSGSGRKCQNAGSTELARQNLVYEVFCDGYTNAENSLFWERTCYAERGGKLMVRTPPRPGPPKRPEPNGSGDVLLLRGTFLKPAPVSMSWSPGILDTVVLSSLGKHPNSGELVMTPKLTPDRLTHPTRF